MGLGDSTFAGFWRGLDIRDRAALGLLAPEKVRREEDRRGRRREALLGELRRTGHLGDKKGGLRAVLSGSLDYLADSPARTTPDCQASRITASSPWTRQTARRLAVLPPPT